MTSPPTLPVIRAAMHALPGRMAVLMRCDPRTVRRWYSGAREMPGVVWDWLAAGGVDQPPLGWWSRRDDLPRSKGARDGARINPRVTPDAGERPSPARAGQD